MIDLCARSEKEVTYDEDGKLHWVTGAAAVNNERFYIAVMAEADEPDLTADVVFDGEHIATASKSQDGWLLTIYGQGSDRVLPLDGFMSALREVAERLR